MSELFRKVLCKDRKPDEDGKYLTQFKELYYEKDSKWEWTEDDGYPRIPDYWMEEVPEPTDEEIEKMAVRRWGANITPSLAFILGYRHAIEDLKGGGK